MNLVLNILKALLINFLFIGLTYAATNCPSISPKLAGEGPTEQVTAILNDVVCSFIALQNKNNGTLISTLNLTKKKIIPYIDLSYSTELALGTYWSQLDNMQKKIFERDIKNSLINDYVGILAEIKEWDKIKITVDDKFTQNDNIVRVKIFVSLGEEGSDTGVILKLVNNNRWKLFDLEYQSISILDIEKIGYDSKIKRQGIKKLVEKMLSKS
jgi:phospholipid transport system substrate-binding protein